MSDDEPYTDAAGRLAPHVSHRNLFPDADENPEMPCAACRKPVPIGGVVGFEQRVVCPRCGVVNLVNADGERGYRIRPGALEATIRQNGEG